MKLKKSELNKIKLLNRKYYSTKYKGKYLKELMLCELDVIDDIQIIRFFEVFNKNVKCIECQRFYIKFDGNYLFKSYGSFFNRYSYNFNYRTNFDFRKYRNIHCYPHKIVIKNILPSLKKYVSCKLLLDTDIVSYISCILENINNNNLESLASINLDLLIKIFNNSFVPSYFIEYIDKYLRCFQLISKWKYVFPKFFRDYLDHLELVSKLGLDLHSPKYIAPVDFNHEHSILSLRYQKYLDKQKLISLELKKKLFIEKVEKYKLNNFKFFENGISIIPLLTIDDVKKEGLENRHCIYSNCYYGKEDSLL
ncbi:MAG: PcfJ domain-containing protein, partial [Mycoplasmataceae bacterium]|nr:PcfJ domain-containing protein [Mycoplasmataceae bacterium]